MRRLASLSIVFLFIMGASLALAQSSDAGAWIDQPLGWEVITATPVQITAHLAHPDGLTSARLDVDGQVEAETGLSGKTFETAEFEWVPPGSGTYLLEVRGRGGGEWGSPAVVEVTVNLGASTQPTSTTTSSTPSSTTTTGRATTTTGASTTSTRPSSTTTTTHTTTTIPATTTTVAPTTTSTSSTTTTSCDLGIPTPTGTVGTTTLTPTIQWSYNGCRNPEQFHFEVSRTSDVLRLEWSGSTGGDARAAEVSVGADCTTYFWRVRTNDSRTSGPWSAIAFFFVQTTRTCP